VTAIKFVNWNMEWMNDLFVADKGPAAFRPDDAVPQHNHKTTVRRRREDLAGVLNELQPDVLVVVEGPNRTDELQLFFDLDVEGTWQTYIQPTKGSTQSIGVAVRTDTGKFGDEAITPFDTTRIPSFERFMIDVDDDGIEENYRFERLPLYTKVLLAKGQEFRILGLHLKSKGIFDAYEWSKWWQVADANRRKLLAQATQLRIGFIDPFLQSEATKSVPLLVCGDINDGPGLDESEKRLFGSTVERLMGLVWFPDLCLRNALFEGLTVRQQQQLQFEKLATTSFSDPIFNGVWHRSWIDHILYSDNQTRPWVTQARIDEIIAGEKIWRKYPSASDHFPISAVIEL
jgi:endonuclease/exonuclease/phosphatase family metal-dependent hydrolase